MFNRNCVTRLSSFMYCVPSEQEWSWLYCFLSTLALSNICQNTILQSIFCHPFTQGELSRLLNIKLSFSCFAPLSVKFSKPSFFIMCPKYLNHHFLIPSVQMSFLFPFSLKLSCCSHMPMAFSAFSIEPYFCCLKSPLHLWRNCPGFTAISEDWYYIAVQYYFLYFYSNFLVPNTLSSFWKASFATAMCLQILVTQKR